MKSAVKLLLTGAGLVVALSTFPAHAAAPPAADCILPGPAGAAATVEHGGKTYHFRDPACKEKFLTDPERFSQLYDTLLELKSEGQAIPKAAPASAVPA